MDKLLDKRIRTMIEELQGFVTPVRLDVTGWKTLPCGYKEDNNVPSPELDGWQDFGRTQTWGDQAEEHRWFYNHIDRKSVV